MRVIGDGAESKDMAKFIIKTAPGMKVNLMMATVMEKV